MCDTTLPNVTTIVNNFADDLRDARMNRDDLRDRSLAMAENRIIVGADEEKGAVGE